MRAARRTSARGAEQPADVLVSGRDEPPWRPTRASLRIAAAAVMAAGTALVVPAVMSEDSTQQHDTVEVVLREGAAALPRRGAAAVEDRVRGGVHVEVVNEGSEPVALLSASLSPGEWQADVVDDLDRGADPGARGRPMRPGWSATLVLHRVVLCTPGADHGPPPTSLVLSLEVGGRTRTRALDLGSAGGGALQDLLGSPARFCAPDGGTAAAGTAGDPGLPFLPLRPAGTGMLPPP